MQNEFSLRWLSISTNLLFIPLLLAYVLWSIYRIWKNARKEASSQPRKVLLEIELLDAAAHPPTP